MQINNKFNVILKSLQLEHSDLISYLLLLDVKSVNLKYC